MGPDPATSVTNPQGRFHDVDNLYACDGSVFPTSSGYNPTLTIIANSLRIAQGIAGRRRRDRDHDRDDQHDRDDE